MQGDLRAFSGDVKDEVRTLSNTAALMDLLPRAPRAFPLAHPAVAVLPLVAVARHHAALPPHARLFAEELVRQSGSGDA